ncbi:MAG: glycosyltransferase family 2 protein [Ktedonobacteraceae bacterium]
MLPLSIIIPSYNRAALVDRTLHSLTKQSRTDFQIILVDHGSTDNTEQVCAAYRDSLHLSYYKLDRDDESFSAVMPRAFGVAHSASPFIAFIDSGMLLPSQYVHAHITFHLNHPNYVGIGLQHGLDLQLRDSREDVDTLLNATDDIEQAYSVLKDAQLRDQRERADLENLHVHWSLGWTANLSMSREAYLAAGGFDLELKGWGFEDSDLSYRLSKQGQRFAFVEGGWGIELPQPRTDMRERLESNRLNMIQCYAKQKTVALEAVILRQTLLQKAVAALRAFQPTGAGQQKPGGATSIQDMITSTFTQQAEDIFCALTMVGQEKAALPAVTIPDEVRTQFTQPTLFIGGTTREAEYYDYVTVGDERVISTPSLWSCCGIYLPLPDQSLGTIVVSDIWKKLAWSLPYPFGVRSLSLLEVLISEIGRVARQAVFIHSSSVSGLSIEVLENLCSTRNLPYKIVLSTEQSHSMPLSPVSESV